MYLSRIPDFMIEPFHHMKSLIPGKDTTTSLPWQEIAPCGHHHCYPIVMVSHLLFPWSVSSSLTLVTPLSLLLKWPIYSLHEKKNILFNACMTKVFVEHSFGGAKIILMNVMTYDHFVAICKSLHYTVIMNWRVCSLLVQVS